MSERFKRRSAWACIVVVQLTALLIFTAAVNIARNGYWVVSLLYLAIAMGLSGATLIGWHVLTRQRPYRWRDKGNL